MMSPTKEKVTVTGSGGGSVGGALGSAVAAGSAEAVAAGKKTSFAVLSGRKKQTTTASAAQTAIIINGIIGTLFIFHHPTPIIQHSQELRNS